MAIHITSELEGVVALIRDFKSKPLLPLFEAIVNSIQAIEDRFGGDYTAGKVRIIIKRESQREFDWGDGTRREPKILGFQIIDNGIGFTDENLASFKLMASKQKASRGGKGIGRFTWLKAFGNVTISSVYNDASGTKRLRKIDFSLEHGINDASPVEVDEDTPIETTVALSNFKAAYRDLPAAYRTTEKIAQRILEHCLVSFLSNQVPSIVVEDETDNNPSFELQTLYNDTIKPHITSDGVNVEGEDFALTELKLYGTNAQMHRMVFCADSREVTTEDIGKRLGTTIQFDEDGKKFVYAVYVTGAYLDSHVLPTRDDFSIPGESSSHDAEAPIGRDSIENAVIAHARRYLQPYLDSLQTKRKELVEGYVAQKNPALRAVVKYCPEAFEEIEPNSSEEKIDEVLYRHKGKAEFEIRKNSEKLLRTQSESFQGMDDKINSVVEKYDAFQKDNLSAYVTYRQFVIDLFMKKIAMRKDGKFNNEDIVHDIVFPRKADSDDIGLDNHNLWLIDDRLAFHACAMSDKALSEFMKGGSDDRPDIVAFADVDPDTRTAKTVSIIEFKKPNRSNYGDEKPPEQVLRMLRQIRENKYLLANQGRPLRVSQEETQFLCYAVCDFTQPILDWALENDYAKMHGEFAYYYYNRNLHASIFLINLDQIAIDARKRNCMFFEKLGVKCM